MQALLWPAAFITSERNLSMFVNARKNFPKYVCVCVLFSKEHPLHESVTRTVILHHVWATGYPPQPKTWLPLHFGVINVDFFHTDWAL